MKMKERENNGQDGGQKLPVDRESNERGRKWNILSTVHGSLLFYRATVAIVVYCSIFSRAVCLLIFDILRVIFNLFGAAAVGGQKTTVIPNACC